MRGSFSNLLFGQTLQTLPGCARPSCAHMRYAGASEGLIASPEGNFSRGKNRKGEGWYRKMRGDCLLLFM